MPLRIPSSTEPIFFLKKPRLRPAWLVSVCVIAACFLLACDREVRDLDTLPPDADATIEAAVASALSKETPQSLPDIRATVEAAMASASPKEDPTSLPDIRATVEAAMASTSPREDPTSLPDIDATVQALVEATLTAIPTPSPEPISTPSSIPVETPSPTPISTPARPADVTEESLPTGSGEGLEVTEVVAQEGSNMVIVLLTEPVHVRGEMWLDTSGGPTALAEGGGSRVLVFRAGDLTGSVRIQGFGYGEGAVLRDIDGNDADTSFEPLVWSIGDQPIGWSSDEDLSAPPRVEGFSTDGEHWRVAFTKPVYVNGDVELYTSRGSQELIVKPDRSSATHVLLFGGGPDWPLYDDSVTIESLRFGENHHAIRGVDGRVAEVAFEPVTWYGFPRPLVPTMTDCVHDAYRLAGNEYSGYDDIDLIRADTIAGTDPSTLTDLERFAWFEFFQNQGYRLRHSCIAFWSEELTEENAEKRNEDFAEGRRGCVSYVANRAREELDGDLDSDIAWLDALTLLGRPYLSLSVTERLILRSQIEGRSECRAYYPQLFSGRWVPLYAPNDD